MAHDSQRGRTVLFGGWNSSAGRIDTTWEFDGSVWREIVQAGPATRILTAMAYDSQRGRTVLFSGYLQPNADTWEWNGANWTTSASAGPSARAGHALVYDNLRGRTVLFGGNFLGDTWQWDGASWTQAGGSGPVGRSGHAMAFHRQRGKVVLFGGMDSGNAYLGDTWEWDGTAWTQFAGVGPALRSRHAMSYNRRLRKVLLFGGMNATSHLGDTWEWDGSWSQSVASGPLPRQGHAMAGEDLTVMHGGNSGTAILGDTWVYTVPGGFATTTPFGTGCGNPPLALLEVAGAGPVLNSVARATLTNNPSSIAFVALGWSRTSLGSFALPLSLAAWGAPGCNLLQSAETVAQPVVFTGPGVALFSLSIPNGLGLLGAHVYLQGWAYAPGVNPGQTIVSNGLDWQVGY